MSTKTAEIERARLMSRIEGLKHLLGKIHGMAESMEQLLGDDEESDLYWFLGRIQEMADAGRR